MLGWSMPAPLAIAPTLNVRALVDDLFADCVGGHDAGGGVGSAHRRASGAHPGDAGFEDIERHRDADQPGRADEHLFRLALELGGREGTHPLGVLVAGETGGGIGVATVDDDGSRSPGTGRQVSS